MVKAIQVTGSASIWRWCREDPDDDTCGSAPKNAALSLAVVRVPFSSPLCGLSPAPLRRPYFRPTPGGSHSPLCKKKKNEQILHSYDRARRQADGFCNCGLDR